MQVERAQPPPRPPLLPKRRASPPSPRPTAAATATGSYASAAASPPPASKKPNRLKDPSPDARLLLRCRAVRAGGKLRCVTGPVAGRTKLFEVRHRNARLDDGSLAATGTSTGPLLRSLTEVPIGTEFQMRSDVGSVDVALDGPCQMFNSLVALYAEIGAAAGVPPEWLGRSQTDVITPQELADFYSSHFCSYDAHGAPLPMTGPFMAVPLRVLSRHATRSPPPRPAGRSAASRRRSDARRAAADACRYAAVRRRRGRIDRAGRRRVRTPGSQVWIGGEGPLAGTESTGTRHTQPSRPHSPVRAHG